MPGRNISPLNIQKLGHELEEIRVRALNNIISKLDYGTVEEKELLANKELVLRLFDWLVKFDKSPEKEKILRFLIRILNADAGRSLCSYLLMPGITSSLRSVQSNTEPTLIPLVDKIINIIEALKSNNRNNASEQGLVHPMEEPSTDSQSEGTYTFNGERAHNPLTRRTTSPVLVHKCQQYKQGYFNNGDELRTKTEEYPTCFPHLLLPWQPLVATDRHVLSAVEDTLKTSTDAALILHSCHFFNDVMLQDFPAEVFLQRPAIVRSFLRMLDTTRVGNVKRVSSVVMKCMCKLSSALHVRIHYYSDPCVANLKQENCTLTDSCVTTPSIISLERPVVEGGAGDYLRNYNSVSDEPAFQYPRMPTTQTSRSASNSDSEVEDSILLQLRQINLPQFCLLTLAEVVPHLGSLNSNPVELKHAMDLIFELTKLLTMCVTSDVWGCTDVISSEIAQRIKQTLLQLGQVLEFQKQLESEEIHRLVYLQILTLSLKVLTSLVPITQADAVVPNSLKSALIASMFDYSLEMLFPCLRKDISTFTSTFSGRRFVDMLNKYNDAAAVCQSMAAAIKFMKHSEKVDTKELFLLMNKALPSIVYHMNLQFVARYMEVCFSKHRSITDNTFAVIVKLLAHSESHVQVQMYQTCHKHVLSVLGVNKTTTKTAQQLAFLFNTNILIEIICHGTTSTNTKIQRYSEEILLHLLKGKFLMSDITWRTFLEHLVPALPLLQCFSNKTSILGRSVSKMLDPDISTSIYLSHDEVLKGNLRLLFSGDPLSRDEAVSRLLWLLSREPQTYDKLPELTSLQSEKLNSLCIVERPTHLARNRHNQAFYEKGSLCHVVELLTAKGVEPVVKRSALTQIAVMLEDVRLHTTFVEQDGAKVVLDILQKALLEKDFLNHPDSAIPIISILKNLAHQNPKLRRELSTQSSLYYCILRASFMFCNDNRLRHDASQLLFLLLYSDLILSIPEPVSQKGEEAASAWYGASLPELVVKRMRVPFLCHTYWRTSHQTETSLRGVLMNDEQCQQLLKLCWNVNWYGGLSKVLSWQDLPAPTGEFSNCLQLDEEDVRILKATVISHCCRQHLYNIQNATSHQAVKASLWSLTGYITLHFLSNKTVSDVTVNSVCWDDLEWEKTLLRFLSTPPACSEDEELLETIIQFLCMYVNRIGEGCCWIVEILKDCNQPLPNLLKFAVNEAGDKEANPSKELCKGVLLLAKECVIMERKWECNNANKQDHKKKRLKNERGSWISIVRTISENLKFSDTQHFYNLAFLDWMLSCLANLTGSIGWSVGGSNVARLWQELITSLAELVTAFHCVRGGGMGGVSFMGLSITRSAVLCMNHLLVEMIEHATNKGWEQLWLSALAFRGDTGLTWLASLWLSRDAVTRAAAVQLAAGLCSSRKGVVQFMEELNIWASGISLLLDHDECCLVREQAGILLTNLTNHAYPCSDGDASSLSLCHASVISGESPLTGMTALTTLFDQENFYGELSTLVSRLSVGPTVDLGGYIITVDRGQWTVESLSGRQVAPGTDLKSNEYMLVYNKNLDGGPLSSSTLSSSTRTSEDGSKASEQKPYVVTTPSLVKSVCWLLVNLLALVPDQVVRSVASLGLSRSLFRCLHEIPACGDDRRALQAYVDVVELNGAVCSALAMCVEASEECRETVLRTYDSLGTLLALLDPAHYPTHVPHLLFLRNRLWTSVFRLLSSLLSDEQDCGYRTVCDALFRSGFKPFFATVTVSMRDTSSTDLLQSALSSLTSLLWHETNASNRSGVGSSCSLQSLLDSPRTADSARREENRTAVAAKEVEAKNVVECAEICDVLLDLYEVHRLQQEGSGNGRGKTAVSGALASLVAVSWEAKRRALSRGLLETVILQLRELHIRLSLDTVESLRRISDKKRICPVLKEVSTHFGLLTNFTAGCMEVKMAATELGLADLVHKLWVWCLAHPPLLSTTLRLLCTLSTACVPACHSLVLTSTVPGVGLRKTAGTVSLLHAVCKLVGAEMEAFGPRRQRCTDTLALAFALLANACAAQECRTVVGKGSLFQTVMKLHPTQTKRQKHWESVEILWLEFMGNFTFYVEGQLSLPKIPDVLDLLITLANCGQKTTKSAALAVLQNVTFNQSNRSRLLSSGEFLHLLLNKLGDGTVDEKCMVASIVWALVTNNQKAKLIVKWAGIDAKLQEAYHLLSIHVRDPDDKRMKMFHYVLSLLHNDDSKIKRR